MHATLLVWLLFLLYLFIISQVDMVVTVYKHNPKKMYIYIKDEN